LNFYLKKIDCKNIFTLIHVLDNGYFIHFMDKKFFLYYFKKCVVKYFKNRILGAI